MIFISFIIITIPVRVKDLKNILFADESTKMTFDNFYNNGEGRGKLSLINHKCNVEVYNGQQKHLKIMKNTIRVVTK